MQFESTIEPLMQESESSSGGDNNKTVRPLVTINEDAVLSDADICQTCLL